MEASTQIIDLTWPSKSIVWDGKKMCEFPTIWFIFKAKIALLTHCQCSPGDNSALWVLLPGPASQVRALWGAQGPAFRRTHAQCNALLPPSWSFLNKELTFSFRTQLRSYAPGPGPYWEAILQRFYGLELLKAVNSAKLLINISKLL